MVLAYAFVRPNGADSSDLFRTGAFSLQRCFKMAGFASDKRVLCALWAGGAVLSGTDDKPRASDACRFLLSPAGRNCQDGDS